MTMGTRTRAWLVFDVLFLVAMFVTATVRRGGFDFPGAGLAAFSIAAWLPLLVRRRWPLFSLIGAAGIETAHIVATSAGSHLTANVAMGIYQPVPLATIVAAFTLAAARTGRSGWRPGVIAAVVLLLAGIGSQPTSVLATDFVVFDLVIIATGAGILVNLRRERRARDERDRTAQIRREVLAERLRIARDLHDVLAHHLTLVNAQAGVADYLLHTDPAAAANALRDITANTRLALDGLRDTVGLLRDDTDPDDPDPNHPAGSNPDGSNPDSSNSDGSNPDGSGPIQHRSAPDRNAELRPAPGLSQLATLVNQFRAAGTTIHGSETGTPQPLSPAADLAAYRILQEALTNATKHAPGGEVWIDLTWQPGSLRLRIDNGPAPGRPGHRGPGTRHGLIGMRERAGTCGGALSAEPTGDGGFSVRATLPTEDARRS
jgi:signal transduction histidine kinase